MAAYEVQDIQKYNSFPGPFWASAVCRWYDEELNLLTVTEAEALFLQGKVVVYELVRVNGFIGRIVWAPKSGATPKPFRVYTR